MIFQITGSLAISAKFRKKTIKRGERLKTVEYQKCLSVIEIYLNINLHIQLKKFFDNITSFDVFGGRERVHWERMG